MVMNNQVSNCVYALRNSGSVAGAGAAGAAGSIVGNTLSDNVFGYSCDRLAYGVTIQNNQFINNNCVYTGPQPINDPYLTWISEPNAAILINGGHHIITKNLFSGNTRNIVGNTPYLAYTNFGIDAPLPTNLALK